MIYQDRSSCNRLCLVADELEQFAILVVDKWPTAQHKIVYEASTGKTRKSSTILHSVLRVCKCTLTDLHGYLWNMLSVMNNKSARY